MHHDFVTFSSFDSKTLLNWLTIGSELMHIKQINVRGLDEWSIAPSVL